VTRTRTGVDSRDGTSPAPLVDAIAAAPDRRPASPRPSARWRDIAIDPSRRTIRLPAGVRIDLGGTAKGLAVDLAAELLGRRANYAVNAGGDIRIGGTQPIARTVHIRHPLDDEVAHSFAVTTGAVATSGLSLAANYVVPNTCTPTSPAGCYSIQQALGRLPANALATGTTTVNLLNPGQLYALERTNLVDMRFAKVLRFGGRRIDAGVDLYNLFNSNVTTAYQQTYEQVTNGAAWLRPTAIAAPRLARLNVTLNF